MIIATLIALDRCHPHLLTESLILSDLDAQGGRPAGLTEVRATLRMLEARRIVVSVRDDLTGELKYKLTDLGRAEVAARS